MNKGNRNVLAVSVLICMLLCQAGCGVQQEKQNLDVAKVATGAVVFADGKADAEAVENQLKIMAHDGKLWRSAGDSGSDGTVRYVVTDLDQNGRWEILTEVFKEDAEREDSYVYLDAYEINASEDGLEKIEIDREMMYPTEYGSMGEDILELIHTAYYDPKSGEYHYMLRREAYYNAESEEYAHISLSGISEEEASIPEQDFYEVMTVLTLKQGKISQEHQGVQDIIQERKQSYQGNETWLDENEYSREEWRDAVYTDCGKMNVWIRPFSFEHSLEDMTEEQVMHALEQSYQGFSMGYPLGKQEMTVSGHKIMIPQYRTMLDGEKQERLNKMIQEEVTRSLNHVCDLQDPEFDLQVSVITVEYAGCDRVSLLMEAGGYRTGAAHADRSFDTLTIDLEEEKVLSRQDLLQGKDWTEIEEDILSGSCKDILGGRSYREYQEEIGSLLSDPKDQQELKYYQTWDGIGVAFSTGYGMDSNVIYEIVSDLGEHENESVAYSEVDWTAYQYRLLPEEYQRLQDFMPVLTGKTDFTWEIWEQTNVLSEKKIGKKENASLPHFLEEYENPNWKQGLDLRQSIPFLWSIAFCDLTQDGQLDLVLRFTSWGGYYLILHQEGKQFYGTDFSEQCLRNLQENGVYIDAGTGGAYCAYFYQMRFQGEEFVEEMLGKEDDGEYSLMGKKVGEKEFEKWRDNTMNKPVYYYVPEAL